jgi:hypothetical protein
LDDEELKLMAKIKVKEMHECASFICIEEIRSL